MKRNQLAYAFICLISISCNGQVKTDAPKETIQKVSHPKLVRSQGTDEYANVHCSLEDKNGNLWFGTTGEGLYKYDGKNFTNFLKEDGLGGNNVWCASWNNEGACSFDGKTLTSFDPNGDNMVYSLLEDNEGNLWFGTREHGVCRYDGIGAQKSYTNFADIPTFSTSCVYSMVQDKTGMIWFATEFGSGSSYDRQGGVWRYDPKTNGFTNFTVAGDGLTHNSVFTVLKTRSEDFWFGTRNTSLCKFDPMGKKQKFIVYSE